MAIRKDLDAMLNSLKNGGTSTEKPKSTAAKMSEKAPVPRKTVYDSMSVDDLLNELAKDKPAAKTVQPVQEEPAANKTISEPVPVKEPEQPKKKKRIVISGELPDYEALRQQELAKTAEAKRLAEETARKAAEEAEVKRLAEEAARKAAEEAEAKRLAEEAARKAAEEAEAVETADTSDESAEDIPEEEPKNGLFTKIKGLFSKDDDSTNADEEAESDEVEAKDVSQDEADASQSDETESTDTDSEALDDDTKNIKEDMQSAADLVDAAIAAIEEVQLEIAEENAADDTAEAPEEENDPVEEMLEDIRDEAANTIAEIEADDNALAEVAPDEDQEETAADAPEAEESIDILVDEPKKKGRITSALERILDEDPDELTSERSEKPEPDDIDISLEKKGAKGFKKSLYAILGLIFSILTVIGLITVVKLGIGYIRSFTAGESKMDEFSEVIYPAVIMDIDSFENPSELSSEQIISAALWSLVMSEDEMSKYEETFNVISVPAVDVEAYAANLFGSDVPELTHGTVGSGELKFYYNEEIKAYNVPVKPITFTYEPSIKSVAKNGNSYTVEVEYINELPAWLKESDNAEDSIAKTVEFRLTESNGEYTIVGMSVISINSEM